jgi:hypothetical protein
MIKEKRKIPLKENDVVVPKNRDARGKEILHSEVQADL